MTNAVSSCAELPLITVCCEVRLESRLVWKNWKRDRDYGKLIF